MKRFFQTFVPESVRFLAKRIYFLPVDLFEMITPGRLEGIPPRASRDLNLKDYSKEGEKFVDYFVKLGSLKPDHSLLEEGCGSGQKAFLLERFLSQKGSYNGFDTVKRNIDWCKKNIGNRNPNFRFHYFRYLNNSETGNFELPFKDAAFDFVFISSVFTLMRPKELELFILELSRVMKPGSTCLAAVYLVNCESEDLMLTRSLPINFPINKGFHRLQSLKEKSTKIAYDEEWLLEKLENAGLKMNDIKYGKWCDRKNYYDVQDFLILSKTSIISQMQRTLGKV